MSALDKAIKRLRLYITLDEDKMMIENGLKIYDEAAAELAALREQVMAKNESIEYISLWASQNHDGLDVAQVTDAIMRMCSDALKGAT